MANKSDLMRNFRNQLSAWASDLSQSARLELDDAGRTVEMHGVSHEKRHELKLLAQRAGIENAHAIESLLYLWLYQWHLGGVEGGSPYFHGRPSHRTVYRGSSKFEGTQVVGCFYPLRDALLDYCNKPQVEFHAPLPELSKLSDAALRAAENEATALPSQVATAKEEKPHSPGVEEGKLNRSSREHAEVAKVRAETVAKLIEELNILKPQMFEDEAEYRLLHSRYPEYFTFKIAQDRPDLKMKIMNIRGSVRHVRLAQELAAAHYGLSQLTIADAWKDHKPPRYKRLAPSPSGRC